MNNQWRSLAKLIKNTLLRPRFPASSNDGDEIIFRCNICGRKTKISSARLTREEATCQCGSSVRLRSIIHLLSLELFNQSLAIPDMPIQKNLIGIDMSGAATYANRLAKKLGYTNTFLHKSPRLDITTPDELFFSTCDFVISSDVFEHVAPPVSRAFENTLRLLKPGGLLILTVPYTSEGNTQEHFPELNNYFINRRHSPKTLTNQTKDGRVQFFEELIFHGGEGETLEMRVFSEDGIKQELEKAGFIEIHIHSAPYLPHGIRWEHPWSLPLTARRPK